MRSTVKVLAVVFLIFGLSLTADADDEPRVSFKFNLQVVTLSITGIEPEALYEEETKEMLKRAAQLVQYSVKQLEEQRGFPRCLRREEPEEQQSGTGETKFSFTQCVEWEK